MSEKLQKVLARVGLASRRVLEEWIRDGRVTVNGEIADLGCRVSATDKIVVDGKLVPLVTVATRIIMYHKPLGQVCTRDDPEGRPTVFEYLPPLAQGRWVQVGRLDINTSGLLLFTNDGELSNRLLHPSYEVEREYRVKIIGPVPDRVLQKLRDGVMLEDGFARFSALEVEASDSDFSGKYYRVIVKEGRNRLVRRLWQSQGFTVNRLQRIRFGSIKLPEDLRPEMWRELSLAEIDTLE